MFRSVFFLPFSLPSFLPFCLSGFAAWIGVISIFIIIIINIILTPAFGDPLNDIARKVSHKLTTFKQAVKSNVVT